MESSATFSIPLVETPLERVSRIDLGADVLEGILMVDYCVPECKSQVLPRPMQGQPPQHAPYSNPYRKKRHRLLARLTESQVSASLNMLGSILSPQTVGTVKREHPASLRASTSSYLRPFSSS